MNSKEELYKKIQFEIQIALRKILVENTPALSAECVFPNEVGFCIGCATASITHELLIKKGSYKVLDKEGLDLLLLFSSGVTDGFNKITEILQDKDLLTEIIKKGTALSDYDPQSIN